MKTIKHLIILAFILLSQNSFSQNFITRWNLATAGSGATQLFLGVETTGTVNYTWTTIPAAASGSGTFNGLNAFISGLPAGATIQLSIQPTNFRRININNGADKSRLIQVEQWGSTLWNSMQNAFFGCNNLLVTATDIPNLGGVTNMSNMFRFCSNLNTPSNINSWNISTVNNLSGVFSYCSVFNQSVSNWNTSSVTDMSRMFENASAFNQNVSSWNTTNVTTMSYMFAYATVFNQPLNSWNVSSVTTFENMFGHASLFNQMLNSWNTSSATNMRLMFLGATAFNQVLNTWNTSSVTDFTSMFTGATSFNQPLNNWDVSSATSISSMFSGATVFNQPLNSWNTSSVTDMRFVFSNTANFNQSLNSWNTVSATNMYRCFYNASAFNQPLNNWNVMSVTNMDQMFDQAVVFNQNLGSWTLNSNVILTNMLSNSGITCSNYSSTLIGWNANPSTPNGRNLGAIGKTYGPSANSARINLVTAVGSGGKGWTITDGGLGAVTPTFTPVASICVGGTLSPLPTTSNNGIIGTWSPALNNTATTIYTFTPNASQCANSTNLTISVLSPMSVSSANPNQTLCVSTLMPSITHSTSGATGIGTPTGLPSGINANWVSNTLTISGTPTVSGTFSYTIPLTGGCGTASATGTITVYGNRTVSIADSNPSLCVNTSLAPLTFTTTNSTGIGTPLGLPSGVTASWSSNTITISGTPTVSGTFNYTIPVTGFCGPSVSATGTITVIPNQTVSLTSSNPTLCVNTALTAITHTTTGATGIGLTTGLPTGVTASYNANTITISGTPTIDGTFNYTIPLIGGCGSLNATGTITVLSHPTVISPVTSTNVCINTTLPTVIFTTSNVTSISSTSGLPPGTSANLAGNTISVTGIPTVSGDYPYTINLVGTCGTTQGLGGIRVRENTVTPASLSPSVCVNTPIPFITHTTTSATGIGTAIGLPPGVTASWSSNKIIITGTPTSAGNFNYSIPLTGGCVSYPATGTITVNPTNTVSSATIVSTCINSVLINHTTTGATGIGISTGLPSGLNVVFSSNSIVISGSTISTGTFNYSIPLTGGCGTVFATGSFTITPNNTVTSASSNPTLCINTPLANITHTTSVATGIGTVTGLPNGVSAIWNSNEITISGTPTESGVFNYSIPLTGGCGSVFATGTITVNPDNTVSLPSSTPTLCINTSLVNITHSTTSATGIGTASGLPNGVSATWNSDEITISGTPTESGVFNYSIPLTGGCETIFATGTITVNPDNTVSLPSSTETLCINTALTNIIHLTTSSTGIGTASGLPNGVTATWNSDEITISGTPTESGVFNYSIPLTGGCGSVFATGTITINPENTVSLPSSTPTLCINNSLVTITHSTTSSTGIGTASGLPNGVSATWNSDEITISGTPIASGVFNYSIPLEGGCGTAFATGTISIDSCVGITDLVKSSYIDVFPNPSNGVYTLKLNEINFSAIHIEIIDLNGSVVLRNEFNNKDEISIDISTMPNSTYLLKINSDNIQSIVRIIKQ